MQFRDALAALDLATELGLQVLGMEGFIVGRAGVYPSMSRIADFSHSPADGAESARLLLAESWSTPPNDVQPEAEGDYMIDIVGGE